MLRELNKENKKARILKSAIELFTKKGFERTTVEDITKRALVAKGTFYNFFEKKEDVLIYFLNREVKRSREEIRNKIFLLNNFFDQMEFLIRSYTKHIFRNKEFAKILFRERLNNWGSKTSQGQVGILQSLVQLIDLAKQKNEIRQEIDSKVVAEIIFAINTMYVMYWLNGAIKSKQECTSQINIAIRNLFEGIGVKRKEQLVSNKKHSISSTQLKIKKG